MKITFEGTPYQIEMLKALMDFTDNELPIEVPTPENCYVKMFLGDNASELENDLAQYQGTLAEFLEENANRIGNFIDKTFESEAEKQAYLEGIEDAYGWGDYNEIQL